MTDIRKVAYCPHCGNRAPQRLIHRQQYLERGWSVPDGIEDEHTWSSFVAVCETCEHLLIYDNVGDQLGEDDFNLGDLVFPESGQLHRSVPATIADAYMEAYRIKELAPNAFAVQLRRAIEALCEDRKAKQGNLYVRLKDLADKGEIPPVLAEATDTLRILGNIGAHSIGESIHPLQTYAIDEFFRVVVEYVYVAPSKLKEFKKELKRSIETPKEKSANLATSADRKGRGRLTGALATNRAKLNENYCSYHL